MKESFSGRITHYFINSPITPLLLIAAFLLGIMALVSLPREEEPQISVPMVDIFVEANGLKAEDAAELVTKPLEDIIKAISEVEHVYSWTEDDRTVVTARFFVGSDQDDAILRVHEKIRANLDKIPYGIKMPLVVGREIDDVPIVVLTLAPKAEADKRWNDTALHEIADKLTHEISKIKDIGKTFIVGGRTNQLRVEPDPEKLTLYGVTLNQIVDKVEFANTSFTLPPIRGNNASIQVTGGQTLQSITDIGLLLVTTYNGRPVYLKDIATITAGGAPVENRVWHYSKSDKDFRPAVSLAIAKRKGANAVTIANEINDRLEIYKTSLLPDDVEIAITRNYGETATEKSNKLLSDLVGATISVVLLVGVAIGWREGSVVLVVIPTTILLTLFFSWMLGYTINRVSLFALIFSIGILVDDAIVFIENIVRRWQLEPSANKIKTAVAAVVEVGNPTIMATLTIIAALLPMLFVSGLMGPYMSPIPVNASIAMILSLMVAFTAVPWLLMRVRKPNLAPSPFEEKITHFLQQFYRKWASKVILNRKSSLKFLIITGTITILSCLLFVTKSVTVKMLPFDNKSEIVVQLDLKEGASLEATERALKDIASSLRDLPELLDMQLYVGVAAPFNFNGLVRHSYIRTKPEQAELQINLKPKHDRSRKSHQIALDIRKRIQTITLPTGSVFKVVEIPPGPPVLSTLLAEIYSPDADVRQAVARKVEDIFKSIDFIVDVDNSFGERAKRLRFSINQENLESYGVDEEKLYDTIKALLNGVRVGYSHRGGGTSPIEIVITLDKSGRTLNEKLLSTPIPSRNGTVELGDVVNLTYEYASYPIYRRNSYDIDMVTAELAGRYEAPIYAMMAVDNKIDDTDWGNLPKPEIRFVGQPENAQRTTLLWDGEWEVTYVTFRDMGIAFAVAVLGIYVLLVAQFGSFKLPVVILVPVPLTLIGIILGHLLFSAHFTATSMIGFIALAGIVVRNSLLLVEFIRHKLSEEIELKEALLEAGAARFRPILLTAMAAMIGAVFMFSDPIFQGLAISLFFGLISSTILTLLAIPAIYIVYKTKI